MTGLKIPPRYVLASMICSAGGFIFGMDTGIIGPVTVMPSYTASFGTLSGLLHGFIVSSILIPAAVSAFAAGRVADAIGRAKAIALGALVFGTGAAMEAGAVKLGMFVAGRVVEGLGEGLFLGNLVVYITEIAPPRSRGSLTSYPQFTNTVGLTVGFFSCYGSRNIASNVSWRLPFILLSGSALCFAVLSWCFLPESPRWLLVRGMNEEASRTWDTLGVESADREKVQIEQEEMGVIGTASVAERGARDKKSGGWLAAFAPDVRERTIVGAFAMGMQQMSGIDGVLYYAPILFESAGLSSSRSSFLASGISAIVIMTATIPALIYADTIGRRTSTIVGGLAMSLIMFLIGTLYATSSVHGTYGAGRWIVVASIYLFAIVFCTTWAFGIKTWVAECQPQRSRSSATNLAYGSNWMANFLVALTTPILLSRSSFGAYFLFGGCALVTAGVCAVWMPETMGKSLEEIEGAFQRRVGVSAGKRLRALTRRAF